jgi:hypothetical protein
MGKKSFWGDEEMELIEGGLMAPGTNRVDLRKAVSLLEKMGIRKYLFPDYFSLSKFSQLMDDMELFRYHFNVLTHPKRESIRMTWDILKSYDSSTIFVRLDKFVQDEEFKEAVYLAKSFTDDVGLVLEAESLLSHPMDNIIQTLQEDFRMTKYLLVDSDGLLLPDELTKLLKSFRLEMSNGSLILFFPRDQHRLGLINALYAMRAGIDGLVGSVLKAKDMTGDIIDLTGLHLLYFHKRKDLYSKRSREILDQTFSSFIATGGEPRMSFLERG